MLELFQMKMRKPKLGFSIKHGLLFSGIGLLISIGCGYIQAQSYIKQAGNHLVIGNRFLERDFQIESGVVETITLHNKLAGQKVPMVSSEFRLVVDYQTELIELTNKDFHLVKVDKKDLEDDGRRLVFLLAGKKYKLEVKLCFELLSDDFYLRKFLGIRKATEEKYLLRDIEVERFSTPSELDLGGFGQPIYLGEETFLGLEYPAGYNEYEGGLIYLRHHPGKQLTEEFLFSKQAVWGVAPANQVEKWFMKYISRIATKPRSFLLYNSWYDIRARGVYEMCNENFIDCFCCFKENLIEKYGVRLDAFVIDDGWQNKNSIWEVEETEFSDGFAPLVNELSPAGCKLGLWLSLPGVKLNMDCEQYEVSNSTKGNYYCLSGLRYHQALKSALKSLIEKYSVCYFKHDFNYFECTAEEHSHLPEKGYGREANIDAEIDLLKFERSLNPDIFLNVTSNMWLSPWWLMFADAVWMGGGDYGQDTNIPGVELRDRAMTYRDGVLYDDFRQQRAQFPISRVMTHGIIYGRYNLLGGKDEPLEKWTDNVVLYFGRGVMMKELYLTPSLLSDEQWEILARAIKWAEANKEVLLQTKMILGDPRRKEVYGYAHFKGNRGIICLRNPDIDPHPVTLCFDSSIGMEELEEKFPVKISYPGYKSLGQYNYGSAIDLEISGCETLILEIGPVKSLFNHE